MSLGLIPLAILMWAVTFPARAMPMLAPGIDRLPPVAVAYLRLAGPTTLAALAAMNCLVTDATPASLVVGIEPVADLLRAYRRQDASAAPRCGGRGLAGGRRTGARSRLTEGRVVAARPAPRATRDAPLATRRAV